jgi:glutamate---cysteine ligase / carboxylate-amine ligase
MESHFQFGIEEEMFLADAQTRGTSGRSLTAFHDAVHHQLPKAERELLQSQIEIASPPSKSFAEARSVLAGLRTKLADVAREHGLLLLASGTHPLAMWGQQKNTEKARYEKITEDMQMIGRRNMVCGMHVHVEVPDPDHRIGLMNRLLPFTPLLLALSASSPFWQGENTGLMAYRSSVWGELPRTGLPDLLQDDREYEHYVDIMVRAGAIKDASFLWWNIRPSSHYPTVELRVADSCTNLEDTIAIAALYRCLVRYVARTPQLNQDMTGVSRAIVSENLWRAQRDGVKARFIDPASGTAVQCADYLSSLLLRLAPEIEEFDCLREIERAKAIVLDGTSADFQLANAGEPQSDGSLAGAAPSVVDWIARATATC